ncbi:MAG: septum formation initiator family protein, partial [Litorimonas sp.]
MVNEAITSRDLIEGVQRFHNISNWPALLGSIQIKSRIPILALFALYAYLAFHAFSGSKGVIRWMDYAERRDTLQTKLIALEGQHRNLEAQVKALKSDGLDLDVLDVEAREILYVSDPNEL